MPSYPPPSTAPGAPETSIPLPNGWVEEYDEAKKAHYYVDTLSLNPRATWVDPRTNPALYSSHNPSLGVTVFSTPASPLPSVQQQSPAAPPLRTYPEYPPRETSSGGRVLLAATGALVAGGAVYRAASSST